MATKKTFDYSKWDNIELSDDESDLHPNIDKDSWFRLKHRTRLEREEKEDKEVETLKKLNSEDEARLSIITSRLTNPPNDEDAEFEDLDALQGERDELTAKVAKRVARMNEIANRRAWNIDNICKVKEERSVVNSAETKSLKAADFEPTGISHAEYSKPATVTLPTPPTESTSKTTPTTSQISNTKPAVTPPTPPNTVSKSNTVVGPEEARGPRPLVAARDRHSLISYNDFVIAEENILETYSEIADFSATKEYLFKHCDILLHEHSQTYLLLSCLEDEMNGKHKRMKLVCRQSQILSHIQELANSLKKDPRDVIIPFFKRLELSEHSNLFTDAVNTFIEKIKKRAIEKRKEMDAEQEIENRKKQEAIQKHIADGGLDPMEVLQSLPTSLREAFESQSMEQLHSVLGSMDPMEARRCMKLCVDSGLWVPSDATIYEEGNEDQCYEEIEEVE